MTEQTPRLSQSIAKVLLENGPFHAWHHHRSLGKLSSHSDAMDRGTLIHELVLGGDKVAVLDHKDWRTNAAKAERDAVRDGGRVPVLAKQVEAVQVVVHKVRGLLTDRFDAYNGEWLFEHRLQWEQDGVACEGTPDLFGFHAGRLFAIDLKTVGTAISTRRMGAVAVSGGWAIQRAAYVAALEAMYPEFSGRIDFAWVIAETDAPYQVRVANADWQMRDLGERQWKRAVLQWRDLIAQGWDVPWKDDEELTMIAPGWAMLQEEENDANADT